MSEYVKDEDGHDYKTIDGVAYTYDTSTTTVTATVPTTVSTKSHDTYMKQLAATDGARLSIPRETREALCKTRTVLSYASPALMVGSLFTPPQVGIVADVVDIADSIIGLYLYEPSGEDIGMLVLNIFMLLFDLASIPKAATVVGKKKLLKKFAAECAQKTDDVAKAATKKVPKKPSFWSRSAKISPGALSNTAKESSEKSVLTTLRKRLNNVSKSKTKIVPKTDIFIDSDVAKRVALFDKAPNRINPELSHSILHNNRAEITALLQENFQLENYFYHSMKDADWVHYFKNSAGDLADSGFSKAILDEFTYLKKTYPSTFTDYPTLGSFLKNFDPNISSLGVDGVKANIVKAQDTLNAIQGFRDEMVGMVKGTLGNRLPPNFVLNNSPETIGLLKQNYMLEAYVYKTMKDADWMHYIKNLGGDLSNSGFSREMLDEFAYLKKAYPGEYGTYNTLADFLKANEPNVSMLQLTDLQANIPATQSVITDISGFRDEIVGMVEGTMGQSKFSTVLTGVPSKDIVFINRAEVLNKVSKREGGLSEYFYHIMSETEFSALKSGASLKTKEFDQLKKVYTELASFQDLGSYLAKNPPKVNNLNSLSFTQFRDGIKNSLRNNYDFSFQLVDEGLPALTNVPLTTKMSGPLLPLADEVSTVSSDFVKQTGGQVTSAANVISTKVVAPSNIRKVSDAQAVGIRAAMDSHAVNIAARANPKKVTVGGVISDLEKNITSKVVPDGQALSTLAENTQKTSGVVGDAFKANNFVKSTHKPTLLKSKVSSVVPLSAAEQTTALQNVSNMYGKRNFSLWKNSSKIVPDGAAAMSKNKFSFAWKNAYGFRLVQFLASQTSRTIDIRNGDVVMTNNVTLFNPTHYTTDDVVW